MKLHLPVTLFTALMAVLVALPSQAKYTITAGDKTAENWDGKLSRTNEQLQEMIWVSGGNVAYINDSLTLIVEKDGEQDAATSISIMANSPILRGAENYVKVGADCSLDFLYSGAGAFGCADSDHDTEFTVDLYGTLTSKLSERPNSSVDLFTATGTGKANTTINIYGGGELDSGGYAEKSDDRYGYFEVGCTGNGAATADTTLNIYKDGLVHARAMTLGEAGASNSHTIVRLVLEGGRYWGDCRETSGSSSDHNEIGCTSSAYKDNRTAETFIEVTNGGSFEGGDRTEIGTANQVTDTTKVHIKVSGEGSKFSNQSGISEFGANKEGFATQETSILVKDGAEFSFGGGKSTAYLGGTDWYNSNGWMKETTSIIVQNATFNLRKSAMIGPKLKSGDEQSEVYTTLELYGDSVFNVGEASGTYYGVYGEVIMHGGKIVGKEKSDSYDINNFFKKSVYIFTEADYSGIIDLCGLSAEKIGQELTFKRWSESEQAFTDETIKGFRIGGADTRVIGLQAGTTLRLSGQDGVNDYVNSITVGTASVTTGSGDSGALIEFNGDGGIVELESGTKITLNFDGELGDGALKYTEDGEVEIEVWFTNGSLTLGGGSGEASEFFNIGDGWELYGTSVKLGEETGKLLITGNIYNVWKSTEQLGDPGELGVRVGDLSDVGKDFTKVVIDGNTELKSTVGGGTLKQLGGTHNLHITGSGEVTLDNSGVDAFPSAPSNSTLTGALETEKGVNLRKTGDGKLTLGEGGLTAGGGVTVAAGELVLKGADNTVAGALSMEKDGTLQVEQALTLSGESDLTVGTLTGKGTITVAESGSLTVGNSKVLDKGLSLQVDGSLTLCGEQQRGTEEGEGAITGSGTLIVDEGGQLSTGSYLNMEISGIDVKGTLSQEEGGQIAANDIVVEEGGKYELKAGTITSKSDGTLSLNVAGAFEVSGGEVTSGSITLSGSASMTQSNGTINGSSITLNGATMKQTGGEIIGGTLKLSDNATLTQSDAGTIDGVSITLGGATMGQTGGEIIGGTLKLSDGARLTQSGAGTIDGVSITLSGSATMKQTGGEIIGGTLKLSDNATLTQSDAGTIDGVSITLSGAAVEQTGGEIIGGTLKLSDGASLTQSDAGTIDGVSITLGGATMEQTGGEIIGGTLKLSDGASLTQSGAGTIDGVSITLSGSATMEQTGGEIIGGTLKLSDNATLTQSDAGTIDGVSITLSGSATMEQTGGEITGGTLKLSDGASLTQSDAGTINGSSITLNGSETMMEQTGGQIIGGTLELNDGASLTQSKGTINGGSITLNGSATLTQSSDGIISGGSITLNGSETMMEQAGGQIIGGTLELNDGASLTQSKGTINGGSITLNGSATLTQSGDGIISGSSITLNGSETMMEQTGGQIIGGTLELSDGATLMQSSGTIDGASITLSGSATMKQDGGQITGGSLELSGGATMTQSSGTIDGASITLSGSATMEQTGGEITGGTLELSGGATMTSNGTINSTSVTLSGEGTNFTQSGGSIGGGATFALSDGATLTLSGGNMNGAVTMEGEASNYDLGNQAAKGSITMHGGSLADAGNYAGSLAIQTGETYTGALDLGGVDAACITQVQIGASGTELHNLKSGSTLTFGEGDNKMVVGEQHVYREGQTEPVGGTLVQFQDGKGQIAFDENSALRLHLESEVLKDLEGQLEILFTNGSFSGMPKGGQKELEAWLKEHFVLDAGLEDIKVLLHDAEGGRLILTGSSSGIWIASRNGQNVDVADLLNDYSQVIADKDLTLTLPTTQEETLTIVNQLWNDEETHGDFIVKAESGATAGHTVQLHNENTNGDNGRTDFYGNIRVEGTGLEAATLEKTGDAALNVHGNLESSGTVQVKEGTLALGGTANSIGTLAMSGGKLQVNGTLALTGRTEMSEGSSGSISGTGNVKLGSGASLTLAGGVSYEVQNTQLDNGAQMSQKGEVAIKGGVITLSGEGTSYTQSGGTISGVTFSLGNGANLTQSKGTIGDASITLSGGASMRQDGGQITGGTLELSDGATMTSNGTVNGTSVTLSGEGTSYTQAGESIGEGATFSLSDGATLTLRGGSMNGAVTMEGKTSRYDLGNQAAKGSITMHGGSLANAGNYEGSLAIQTEDTYTGALDLGGVDAARITQVQIGASGTELRNLKSDSTLTFRAGDEMVVGEQHVVYRGGQTESTGGTMVQFQEGKGQIAFDENSALRLHLKSEVLKGLEGQLEILFTNGSFSGMPEGGQKELEAWLGEHFVLDAGLEDIKVLLLNDAEGGRLILTGSSSGIWIASRNGQNVDVADLLNHYSAVIADKDLTLTLPTTQEETLTIVNQLRNDEKTHGDFIVKTESGATAGHTVQLHNANTNGDNGGTEFYGNIRVEGTGLEAAALEKTGDAVLNVHGNVESSGTVQVKEGTLALSGEANSVGTLAMSGGKLQVDGTLALTGTTEMSEGSSGSISGEGNVKLGSGASLTLAGGVSYEVQNTQLDNGARMNQKGEVAIKGGVITLSGKGTSYAQASGTISGATFTLTEGASFAQAGGSIDGGAAFSLSDGANLTQSKGAIDGASITLSGSASMRQDGGQITGGTLDLSGGATMTQSNGTINGTSVTLSGEGTSYTQAGGSIGEGARFSLSDGAKLTLSGGSMNGAVTMEGETSRYDLGNQAAEGDITMHGGNLENAGSYAGKLDIQTSDTYTGALDLGGVDAARITSIQLAGKDTYLTGLKEGSTLTLHTGDSFKATEQNVWVDGKGGPEGKQAFFQFGTAGAGEVGTVGVVDVASGAQITLNFAGQQIAEAVGEDGSITLKVWITNGQLGGGKTEDAAGTWAGEHFVIGTGWGLNVESYDADQGLLVLKGQSNIWDARVNGDQVAGHAEANASELDLAEKVIIDENTVVAVDQDATIHQLDGEGEYSLELENKGEGDKTITLRNQGTSESAMGSAGDTVFGGDILAGDGVNLRKTGDAALEVQGSLKADGDVAVEEGKLVLGGNGEHSIGGELSLGKSGTLQVDGSLTLSGSMSRESAGTFTGQGTVILDGENVTFGDVTLGEQLTFQMGKAASANFGNNAVTLQDLEGRKNVTAGGVTLTGEGTFSGTITGDTTMHGEYALDGATIGGTLDNSGKESVMILSDASEEALQVQKNLVLRKDATTRIFMDLSNGDLWQDGASDTMVNVSRNIIIEDGTIFEIHNLKDIIASNEDLKNVVIMRGAHVYAVHGRYEEGSELDEGTIGKQQMDKNVEVKLTGTLNWRYKEAYVSFMNSKAAAAEAAEEKIALFREAAPAAEALGSTVSLTLIDQDVNPVIAFAETFNEKAGAALLSGHVLRSSINGVDPDVDRVAEVIAGAMQSNPSVAHKALAAMAGSTLTSLSAAQGAALRNQTSRVRDHALLAARLRCQGNDEATQQRPCKTTHVWLEGTSFFSEQHSIGDESGYRLNSWGGAVGIDAQVNAHWSVGLSLAANYGDLEARAADYAKGDLDSYYVSAWSQTKNGRWGNTLLFTAGTNEADLRRTVNYGAGSYTATSNASGSSLGAMWELTCDFHPVKENKSNILQPLFNVAVQHTSMDGFSEKNAGGVGLATEKQTRDTVTLALGARWLAAISSGKAINRAVNTELHANVAQDLGDRRSVANVALLTDPNFTQSVYGSKTGSTAFQFGAGVNVPMTPNSCIYVNAGGELREHANTWNATLGVRMGF